MSVALAALYLLAYPFIISQLNLPIVALDLYNLGDALINTVVIQAFDNADDIHRMPIGEWTLEQGGTATTPCRSGSGENTLYHFSHIRTKQLYQYSASNVGGIDIVFM